MGSGNKELQNSKCGRGPEDGPDRIPGLLPDLQSLLHSPLSQAVGSQIPRLISAHGRQRTGHRLGRLSLGRAGVTGLGHFALTCYDLAIAWLGPKALRGFIPETLGHHLALASSRLVLMLELSAFVQKPYVRSATRTVSCRCSIMDGSQTLQRHLASYSLQGLSIAGALVSNGGHVAVPAHGF